MASNPCPGQAGGIPKLTSSDFKPVDCIVSATPKGSVHGMYQQVGKYYSQDMKALNSRRNGIMVEAAASSTNKLQRHSTLPANREG